jgi:hypothetical protein
MVYVHVHVQCALPELACYLFVAHSNDAVSSSYCIASNSSVIMNNQLERMLNDAVIV